MDKRREVVNGLIVENYWITVHDSGIVSIMFNTIDKWVGYHRYNDNSYLFSTGEEEEIEETELVTIENFELNGKYVCTESQNKDQITFYYIPYKLIL